MGFCCVWLGVRELHASERDFYIIAATGRAKGRRLYVGAIDEHEEEVGGGVGWPDVGASDAV